MTLEYILGGILAVLAIVLIVLIGKQQGKRRGLGNSIAGQGASETYLSRNNIGNKNKSYQKWTLIVAIAFVVLVLALYVVGSIEPKTETPTTPSNTVSNTVNTTSKEETSKEETSKEETSKEETSKEDTSKGNVSETVSETASATLSE